LGKVLHIPGAANLLSDVVLANKGYTITRTALCTKYTEDDGTAGRMHRMYAIASTQASLATLLPTAPPKFSYGPKGVHISM
jgi:hypothetical protein